MRLVLKSVDLVWVSLIQSTEGLNRTKKPSKKEFTCSLSDSLSRSIGFLLLLESESECHSCPILCDLVGYTVHGILQTRILECVAVPFSRGSSQPRDQAQVSRIASGFFTS